MDPNRPGFQVVNGAPFYLNGVRPGWSERHARGLVKNDYDTLATPRWLL